MRDWIVGLRKAALERRLGVSDTWLAALESDAGFPLPGDLKDLYREMDGGRFPQGVLIFSVRPTGGLPGVLDKTRAASQELPSESTWRFGSVDKGGELFVAPKRTIARHWAGQPLPDWMDRAAEAAWVFGAQAQEQVQLFPSLEELLASVIPPASTEVFGENTFHRALSAVEGAVEALERNGSGELAKPQARKVKR